MAGTGEEPLNREIYRIPGHAGWFSWNAIHAIEKEALAEFFEGKTLSKTPKIYKEYRDFMINKYRENPRQNIAFTEIRKMLVGDVNCLRRVFEFLEQWGLINSTAYSEPEAPGIVTTSTPPGMYLGSPALKPPFATTSSANLGSRDSVMQPKLTPVKPGQIGQAQQQADANDEWSSKETMLLLEGLTKHGENWDRVAQHVGSKTKVQCVKQFVGLPFGDQFLDDKTELMTPVAKCMENGDASKPVSKKQKLSHAEHAKARANASQVEAHLLEEVGITPLSDSSNPILAEAALMAAMVGPRVAAAAAQAALAAIAEEEPAVLNLAFNSGAPAEVITTKDEKNDSEAKDVPAAEPSSETKSSAGAQAENAPQEKEQPKELSAARARLTVATALAAASVKAKTLADQEEREIEHLVSNLIEVQLRKLYSKMEHFEELEHLMEKERMQMEEMREQLFLDRVQLKRQQFAADHEKL